MPLVEVDEDGLVVIEVDVDAESVLLLEAEVDALVDTVVLDDGVTDTDMELD